MYLIALSFRCRICLLLSEAPRLSWAVCSSFWCTESPSVCSARSLPLYVPCMHLEKRWWLSKMTRRRTGSEISLKGIVCLGGRSWLFIAGRRLVCEHWRSGEILKPVLLPPLWCFQAQAFGWKWCCIVPMGGVAILDTSYGQAQGLLYSRLILP